MNNVLTPDQLSKPPSSSEQSSSDPSSHIMSGVTPQSTTAQLAGQVPKESERDRSSHILSGVTPQSTTAQLAGQVPKESDRDQETANTASSNLPGTFPETPGLNEASGFSVNPIPATSGIGNPINLEPGKKVPHPSTLTDNTINSTVQNDSALSKSTEDSEKTFGVAPLPATSGIGNPIHLQPGEKVPDPSTFTNNTIQSTVRTDPESYEKGQGAPQLPNVVTPPDERDAEGGMFNLPGISKNMIPESSLPMGGSSSAEKDPGFTIQSAGAGTTTAALAANVPKEPRGVPQVIGGTQQAEKEDNPIFESTGGAGATTSTLPSRSLPPSVQQSIDEINKGGAIAPTVPDVVQESITESHQSPEAAGDKAMVQEKRNVEAELLKGTEPDQSTGEPAPAISAALVESAPAPTADSAQPSTSTPAPSTEPLSQAPAPTDPRSIPTDTAAAASEPAAPTSADVPATTPAAENAKKRDAESREISPMTRPDGTRTAQTQPLVTSGVRSGTAAPTTSSKATSSKPTAGAPGSSSGGKDPDKADKAKKRGSGFFGKLKQKFGDKKQ